MYKYVNDKEYLKNLKSTCNNIMSELRDTINDEGKLSVIFTLIGSGAKNLITQNAEQAVDLDYNLVITKFKNFEKNQTKEIKEYVRKVFNKVLNNNGWDDCQDSTSVLATQKRVFKKGSKTPFSIEVCIVYKDNKDIWNRLIHNKTGNTNNDNWVWNMAPNSMKIKEKVNWLKENGHWNNVRVTYLEKKNLYLKRNDYNHPSFICYIEAVNDVYNKNKYN